MDAREVELRVAAAGVGDDAPGAVDDGDYFAGAGDEVCGERIAGYGAGGEHEAEGGGARGVRVCDGIGEDEAT